MRIMYIVDRWSWYLVSAHVDQASEGRAHVPATSFSSEDFCCKNIDDLPVPVEVYQSIKDQFCQLAPPSAVDSLPGRMARKRNRLDSEVESLVASTIETSMWHLNLSIRTTYLLLIYQIRAANLSRSPAQRLSLPSVSTVARRVKQFRQANTDQFVHLPCYELPSSIVVDRGQK
jgi:hypothetical protein